MPYQYIGFLPFIFTVCYLLILLPLGRKSVTVKIISLCAFLRYVILSVFQSLQPIYSFSGYTIHDMGLISKSIVLMCYELIFVSLFIKFYFSIKHSRSEKSGMKYGKQRFTSEKNKHGLIFAFSFCAIYTRWLIQI